MPGIQLMKRKKKNCHMLRAFVMIILLAVTLSIPVDLLSVTHVAAYRNNNRKRRLRSMDDRASSKSLEARVRVTNITRANHFFPIRLCELVSCVPDDKELLEFDSSYDKELNCHVFVFLGIFKLHRT